MSEHKTSGCIAADYSLMSTRTEIRIVILGGTGVGKTTFLNGLFPILSDVVPMCRSTKSIEIVRISSNKTTPAKKQCRQDDRDSCETPSPSTEKVVILGHNVYLDDQVLDLQDNTTLVMIDTPGIDECSCREMSFEYIKKNWLEFDCVILVIDVNYRSRKGYMIKLLQFLKQQNVETKDIPIIILCNKVDNPNDADVLEQVKSMRMEVQRIFGIGDRKEALERMLAGTLLPVSLKPNPCFIPISSKNEFFNAANDADGHHHHIIESNFQSVIQIINLFIGGMDMTLSWVMGGGGIVHNLNRLYDRNTTLGITTNHIRNDFWTAYIKEKENAFSKLKANVQEVCRLHAPMYELVSFAQNINGKLHASPNDYGTKHEQLLEIVSEMKGLIRRQFRVIKEQESNWVPIDPDIFESIYCPSFWEWREWIPDDLEYPWCKRFPMDHVRTIKDNNPVINHPLSGWYNTRTGEGFPTAREQHPANHWPCFWEWDGLNKLWMNKYSSTTKHGSSDINPATLCFNWASLTPNDWSTILSSMFTVSGDPCFYENFGKEMTEKNLLFQNGRFQRPEYCYKCDVLNCKCEKIGVKYIDCMAGSYVDGSFVPTNKRKYDHAMQIKIPQNLSDPGHWGHLCWMFVVFMKSLSGTMENV